MRSLAVASRGVSRPSPHALAYTGLVISTFGWAAAFIAGKVVLAEMTPLATAAWRYALASLLLLPFAARQTVWPLPSQTLGPLAAMVLCGGVLYPWLFLVALRHTSATNTALLIALNPALTLLLSPLVGERVYRRAPGGIVVALLGAAPVITGGDFARVADLGKHIGDLIAVVAALCWAAFNLASRRVVGHFTASFVNCAVYGLGGIALFFLAWSEHPWVQLANASSAALLGLVVMAVLSSIIAGQFFLFGVRTVGVNRTVVFVYLVPVLTAVLSVTLLGEPFAIAQALGGAAVLFGVYYTTSAK